MILRKFLLMLIFSPFITSANLHQVTSPDETLKTHVRLTDKIHYNLEVNDEEGLWYSPGSLSTVESVQFGRNPRLIRSVVKSVQNRFETSPGIRKTVEVQHNELVLDFCGNYSILFRTYDERIVYRWKTTI